MNRNKQTVNKNFILNFISDLSGQGTIRNVWPFQTVNAIYGPKGTLVNQWSHMFLKDPMLLTLSRTLYFQRQMNPGQVEHVKEYKANQANFNYRMVYDMDDMIWGYNEKQGGNDKYGIPVYNGSWKNINKETKDASIEIMKNMDMLSFSTQYLCDYVKNELNVDVPSVVIPNTVPMAYYGEERREHITHKIDKPVVLYTGSPTHYSNKDRLLGDWDNAWLSWVIKSVENDEIDFNIIGGMPWFFENIADKITVHQWTPIFRLHTLIKNIKPDFSINPLVPNDFNHSKSDLKRVEASASGMVCAGTVFTNKKPSPYDACAMSIPDNASVTDIDTFFDKFTEPKYFNKELDAQYQFMYDEARYTELPKNINRLIQFVLGEKQ